MDTQRKHERCERSFSVEEDTVPTRNLETTINERGWDFVFYCGESGNSGEG
jgi:hypothetical protein